MPPLHPLMVAPVCSCHGMGRAQEPDASETKSNDIG